MWVEISEWQDKWFFARKLIDRVKEGIKNQTVEYEGKWWRIIDGIYGHCQNYPRGFKVELEEIPFKYTMPQQEVSRRIASSK